MLKKTCIKSFFCKILPLLHVIDLQFIKFILPIAFTRDALRTQPQRVVHIVDKNLVGSPPGAYTPLYTLQCHHQDGDPGQAQAGSCTYSEGLTVDPNPYPGGKE